MDLDLYKDAYIGTAESLAAVIDSSPSVKQIIFTGSWSAYGNAGGADEVNEDTPPTPASPFSQVFIDTENTLFAKQSADRRVCVYRTGTIYGPQVGYVPRGLQAQTLPMAGQTVPFDGNAPAAIVHRDDVVRAIDFAIQNELDGIYNLINDVSETKESFFGKIIEAAGKDPINWVGAGTGPKSLSNAKIKSAGFRFGDADASRDSETFL
jgi:nucleoside-diphosphate-sugar epimerase